MRSSVQEVPFRGSPIQMSMTMTNSADEERLDATFAALANSTRRRILQRLAQGEASVTELAEPFELSMPAISRHLRVLQEAGLVRQGRRAQYRPCALEAEPLAAAADWTEQYRPIWEARFDRMEEYLAGVGADPGEPVVKYSQSEQTQEPEHE